MPSTSTSRTVTGLTNGTAYTFRVAAVNHTVGDYSGTVSATPSAIRTITLSGSHITSYGAAGVYTESGTRNGKPQFVRNNWTIYWYFDGYSWYWAVHSDVSQPSPPYSNWNSQADYNTADTPLPPASGWWSGASASGSGVNT